MNGRHSHVATALAFLIACGSDHHPIDDNGQPTAGNDSSPGSGAPPGGDAGPPAPACPLGTTTWQRAIGLAAPTQASDVAVDAAGNVVFATTAAGPGAANGTTKLSPAGDLVFSLPYGSVVATDRAGNTYIAGSFTAPIDLGLGVIEPQGNIDVFVVELDAAGKVVFARGLGLCGDGVQSIAVDAAGRLAVSGTAMGTAVLAPDGKLEFDLAPSGDVAFDSHGDLVIAGTFTTSVDLGDGPVSVGNAGSEAFVIEVDHTGQRIWSYLLTGGGVHATSVAVDASDAVVLAGYYERSIVLFGDEFHAIFAGESGRVTGAYLAKLDPRGNVIWKRGMATGVEANGVAVDAAGNVITTGALTGDTGFFRIVAVGKLDAVGAPIASDAMFPASGDGRGFAVATDACGSIYTTAVALDTPDPGSPSRAYVVKLAL
jgi:catechol 2,3-dioxygenase-like lactoylglutathione lyase family enzyme